MVVLFVFSRLEQAMRRELYHTLVIETAGSVQQLTRIRSVLAEYDVEIRDLTITEGRQPDHVRVEFYVKVLPDQPREEIVAQLLRLERVVEAHWV